MIFVGYLYTPLSFFDTDISGIRIQFLLGHSSYFKHYYSMRVETNYSRCSIIFYTYSTSLNFHIGTIFDF